MLDHTAQGNSQHHESGSGKSLSLTMQHSPVRISPIQKNDEFLGSNNFLVLDGSKKSSSLEVLKHVLPTTREKIKKAFSKKMVYRRIPILSWLPKYDTACLVGDFIAGITVGVTLIPQALAYHSIVGLPPEYGLYSSFPGMFYLHHFRQLQRRSIWTFGH
ncbi:hypothetical protein JTB14_032792 [Gonioctena quinquepunctata]|nr:hypothetical protein JTB14_032792 [Gonioctena quinquepunctata]